MKINDLVKDAHKNAVEKGFWEDFINNKFSEIQETKENVYISQFLMLIVSELGEAQEALRKNDWDNFKEELADVAIRLGDLCGGLNIDLEAEILNKMNKNSKRPYKHGKEF